MYYDYYSIVRGVAPLSPCGQCQYCVGSQWPRGFVYRGY